MAAEARRYSTVAIWLHWLIGVIVIANIIGGLGHDALPAGQRGFVMGLHKSFGLAVLALTFVRIGWRLANPPPPLPAYLTGGERALARVTHLGFYVLLLLLPLSGWAMASLGKRPTDFFGLFEVPRLPLDPASRGFYHESHETLGWIAVATIALHILAVIKHQVFDRDDSLARMLPRTGRRVA